tara:strand:- start:8631 stop:9503 length:873 start_codon:yes stop_codon:yes gene_type:complete
MVKKAIILCGGTGSRMFPSTLATNKHLMPVYDKPMFFYPLSVLMLSGIKNFLLIINPGQKKKYVELLNPYADIGINIEFVEQKKPGGIPEAFILGEKFIGNDSVALILGDNFFYGSMLTPLIKQSFQTKKGTNIYLYPSKNTSAYGVVELNQRGKIKRIVEKPKFTKSNLIITGLYVFDKNVSSYAKKLKPSKRNELEIVDLINIYKKKNNLKLIKLGRGTAWLDVGSYDDFLSASNYVKNIEDRQSYKIGCLEEIAFNNKWITKKNILNRIAKYKNSKYSEYLKDIIKN